MNNMNPKILNLMQFARKAGKLVAGVDACMRGLHHKHIHLLIVAADTAERTVKRVHNELSESGQKLPIIQTGSQEEISAALGLPKTGVFGIGDKNFAAKISEYWQA
jgi:ribosomal protein L7Ae-like RNA K-turn-binding protein